MDNLGPQRCMSTKVSLLSIFVFILDSYLDSFAKICFYVMVLKLKAFSFFQFSNQNNIIQHRKRVNRNNFLKGRYKTWLPNLDPYWTPSGPQLTPMWTPYRSPSEPLFLFFSFLFFTPFPFEEDIKPRRTPSIV